MPMSKAGPYSRAEAITMAQKLRAKGYQEVRVSRKRGHVERHGDPSAVGYYVEYRSSGSAY
jgi:hypothetical protein